MLRHGLALALSTFLSASLAGAPDAAAQSAAPSPTAIAALETALWSATKAGGQAVDFEAYLDRYPQGRYSVEAKERLSALKPAPAATRESAARAEAALDLDRAARRDIQERLAVLGYGAGGVDGLFGAGTRRAISAWQSASGMSATGHLDLAQIARLVAATDGEIAAWRQERRAEEHARRAEAKPAKPKAERVAAPQPTQAPEKTSEPVRAASVEETPEADSASPISFTVADLLPDVKETRTKPTFAPTTAQRSVYHEDEEEGCYK